MKKLLFAILIMTCGMTCGITSEANATDTSIGLLGKPLILTSGDTSTVYGNQVIAQEICVSGYKYLLTWKNGYNTSPSVVQMFENSGTLTVTPPQPISCNN